MSSLVGHALHAGECRRTVITDFTTTCVCVGHALHDDNKYTVTCCLYMNLHTLRRMHLTS